MSSTDSTQLLKEYADHRSESAFRELVERYVDFVFSVALRQSGGDRHLAEDIAQTVFTDLARKVSASDSPLRDPSVHLGGWLHRHTCFVGSNVRRSNTRRQTREEAAMAMSSLHPEPETDQGWRAVAPCLDEAIQELAAQDREAILLRFYEHLDLRRLGRHFGVTEDAAQKRVARAMDRLRDRLAAKGIATSALTLAAILPDRAVRAAPLELVDSIHRAVLVGAAAATATVSSVSTGAAAGIVGGSVPLISTKLVWALAVVIGLVGGIVFFARPSHPTSGIDTDAARVPTGRRTDSAALSVAAADVVVPNGISVNASVLTEARKPTELRLTLLAADTGRPVAGVPVEYRGWEGEHFTRHRLESDAAGLCEVPLESGTTHLELTTRRDGFSDTCLEWWPERGQAIPSDYTVRLTRPVRIGGLVVDADGNAVFGAKVGFNHDEMFNGGSVESHRFGWVEVETDVSGRWRIDRIDEDILGRIYGAARHPDHADSPLLKVAEDPEAEKSLRTESLVLRLGRADTIKGSVVDSQGQPIAAARILVGMLDESGSRQGTTDGMGNFTIAGCRPGETLITAAADGFAPHTQPLVVGPETEALRLVLSPGKQLRLRVLNRDDQPVEGAQVWFDTLGDGPRFESGARPPVQVEFAPKTDSEGRVTWTHAPDTELSFDIAKSGYSRTNGVRIRPNGEEHSVVLPYATAIHGTVVDDATGNPIQRFRIVTGWPQSDPVTGESTPQWSTLKRFTMKFEGGEFQHAMEEAVIQGIPNPGYQFRFEAEGYLPHITRPVKPEEGRVWLEVRLKAATSRELSILRPDGQVAPFAEVVGLTAVGRAILGRGRFEAESTARIHRGDRSGLVQFLEEPQTRRIVAVHESGFLDLPFSELSGVKVLTLKPWAKVEVRVWSHGEPVAGVEMHLLGANPLTPGLQLETEAFAARSGTDGRLEFPRVPPTPLRLTRLRNFASAGNPRVWSDVFVKALDPAPGEALFLEVGRTDRCVSMRLILPAAVTSPIVSAVISSPIPTPPAALGSNLEAFREWRSRPEVAAMIQAVRTYPMTRAASETWTAEDVPVGSYSVRVSTMDPSRPPEPGKSWPVLQAAIEIAEGPADNVVDLGDLRLR
ncbi:MAG: sigma-70 family RNA polymerase sigma factor [Verrucomicrobiales bacterium]|nr:sigma-70 family RNA polymerase sigma factor [Verrucomicrobiales bacterium]